MTNSLDQDALDRLERLRLEYAKAESNIRPHDRPSFYERSRAGSLLLNALYENSEALIAAARKGLAEPVAPDVDLVQVTPEQLRAQVADLEAQLAVRDETIVGLQAERDSWEQQFYSASAAASQYVEFYEEHLGDFDVVGNYIPHSQLDGDLRAVKAQLAEATPKLARVQGLVEALEAAKEMIDKALPGFDWGRSFLSAEQIRLLNETPGIINRALSAFNQKESET